MSAAPAEASGWGEETADRSVVVVELDRLNGGADHGLRSWGSAEFSSVLRGDE